MTREEFLLRIQRICFYIENLTKEYGSDKVISLVVLGCMENNEDGIPRMSALYNYNIEDREELINVIEFIDATWNDEENHDEPNGYKDIDDLLDGTGVELED